MMSEAEKSEVVSNLRRLTPAQRDAYLAELRQSTLRVVAGIGTGPTLPPTERPALRIVKRTTAN